MTLLHEAVDSKKLDVRMIERGIARGTLSQSDLEKATQKLPDDAENADWISIESLADSDDESSSGSDEPVRH